MTTLQINQENRRLQEIRTTLEGQYSEEWHRVNEGKGSDRIQPIREEIKSVKERIEKNWNLHVSKP